MDALFEAVCLAAAPPLLNCLTLEDARMLRATCATARAAVAAHRWPYIYVPLQLGVSTNVRSLAAAFPYAARLHILTVPVHVYIMDQGKDTRDHVFHAVASFAHVKDVCIDDIGWLPKYWTMALFAALPASMTAITVRAPHAAGNMTYSDEYYLAPALGQCVPRLHTLRLCGVCPFRNEASVIEMFGKGPLPCLRRVVLEDVFERGVGRRHVLLALTDQAPNLTELCLVHADTSLHRMLEHWPQLEVLTVHDNSIRDSNGLAEDIAAGLPFVPRLRQLNVVGRFKLAEAAPPLLHALCGSPLVTHVKVRVVCHLWRYLYNGPVGGAAHQAVIAAAAVPDATVQAAADCLRAARPGIHIDVHGHSHHPHTTGTYQYLPCACGNWVHAILRYMDTLPAPALC